MNNYEEKDTEKNPVHTFETNTQKCLECYSLVMVIFFSLVGFFFGLQLLEEDGLCTITTTKEEQVQRGYRCNTCQRFGDFEFCAICAKVCHKDHEVSYTGRKAVSCNCGDFFGAWCQVC